MLIARAAYSWDLKVAVISAFNSEFLLLINFNTRVKVLCRLFYYLSFSCKILHVGVQAVVILSKVDVRL